MLKIPEHDCPIVKILENSRVQLYMKREDLIHSQISGNKYWKLFYNVNEYLAKISSQPKIITFGGAFSNHIAAVAAFGHLYNIPTVGIIRGHELETSWQENPTLLQAAENGMVFKFVTRQVYRDKDLLARVIRKEQPNALLIPEGGTNASAVEGIKMMLNEHTKDFNYLCTAVGTGGTVSGLSKFCLDNQKVIAFSVVKDSSLPKVVKGFSNRQNLEWVEASYGGYGKINEEIVEFINRFKKQNGIPLDPIYTGKMMMRLKSLIEEEYFPVGSRILAFHTGGLQGIEGANLSLKRKNQPLIEV